MRKDNKCSVDNLQAWKALDTLTLDALKPFQPKQK
jgi:hypothetical protein